MGTVIRIRTWRSPCGYSQDFDPALNDRFGFSGLQAGVCPSCGKDRLTEEQDDTKKVKVTIADAAEVAASVDSRADLTAAEKASEKKRLLDQRVTDLAKHGK